MSKSIFYHAGCSVCVSAEQELLQLINPSDVEVVHLGNEKDKIKQAKSSGVKSVPALVTPTGNVLHINYGASIQDVEG